MAWVPDASDSNKQRCTVHDHAFGRLDQCVECLRAPRRRAEHETDEPPEPTPADCLAAIEHEKRLTAIAAYADGVARELCGPGDDRNIPAAAKMFDVAIKAHRAAGEYTISRERKNYVARLERTVARLRGGRN